MELLLGDAVLLEEGRTLKNAPRNEFPCIRSCSSGWLVALRAMSKPGRIKITDIVVLHELPVAGGDPLPGGLRGLA